MHSPPSRALCSSFFYGYGDHRDLHSFPTRRSSDLPPELELARALACEHDRVAIRPEGGIEVDEGIVGQLASLRTIRDRKSTRLNSSHSQISYAVFCLKKKKKNNNDKIAPTPPAHPK